MKVTGALLADSASSVDGKLDIQGGVVDAFRVGADRTVATALVVLLQPEPADQAPTVGVTLTKPGGRAEVFDVAVPAASLGGAVGFVVYPLGIVAPVDGRYHLTVSGHSSSATLPFSVHS